MPVSIFFSGDSFVDATSRGIRDTGYLATLQRELTRADQQIAFDAQANPLRLSQLQESIRAAANENRFAETTFESRAAVARAQAVITGVQASNALEFGREREALNVQGARQQITQNEIAIAANAIGLGDLAAQSQIKAADRARTQAIIDQGRKAEGLPAAPQVDFSAFSRNTQAGRDVATRVLGSLTGTGSAGSRLTSQDPARDFDAAGRLVEDFSRRGPVYQTLANTYGEGAATQMAQSIGTATEFATAAATAVDASRQQEHQLKLRVMELETQLAQARNQAVQTPTQNNPAPSNPAPSNPAPSNPAPAPAPTYPGTSVAVPPVSNVARDVVVPPSQGDFIPVIRALPDDDPTAFEFDTPQDPPQITGQDTDPAVGATYYTTNPNTNHSLVFRAMVQQESGGRQLGANGAPLRSSAGAIGAAQVMPATAREIAREMGIQFDDNRYKTDKAYNLALGQAYFNKMLRMYGDSTLAVAAYNAGPGNVNKALRVLGDPRKGTTTYSAWVEGLPRVYKGLAETRDYVRKVNRNIGALQRTK